MKLLNFMHVSALTEDMLISRSEELSCCLTALVRQKKFWFLLRVLRLQKQKKPVQIL